MGEALFELEQTLRSGKYQMTREEAMILNSCKANAVRAFTVSASVSSCAVWAAMWKFGYGFGSRIGLSGGTGMFCGMWRFNKSLNMSVDKILSMEGSRMQRELANLILSKQHQDPGRMELMKKHFYMERVFDDSHQDRPIPRWRFRAYFGDTSTQNQGSHDSSDSNKNRTDVEPRQTTEPKQFVMSPSTGLEVMVDPLECVFGYSGMHEEIHHPDKKTTEGSPKRRTRDHKRTHRRRRVRNAEAA